MDRQQRHDLKHDKFIDEIGDLTQRAQANQRVLYLIGASAIAIALLVWGFLVYRSNREEKAQLMLATAIDTIESPLQAAEGQQPNPAAKFKTDAERTQAADKQFRAVMSEYSGSDASDVASLYVARIDAGSGKSENARKLLSDFIDSHPKHMLVDSARFSLYQMRIEGGEAAKVATELESELSKEKPVLPGDSMLILLAHAYDSQGNLEKMRDSYRRITTQFPDSPFAMEANRRIGA